MKKQGFLEFTVVERSDELVVSELPIGSGVKNPFGVVQAGAILWFADVSATILVLGSTQVTEEMPGFPVAIKLNASFLGNQREGTLRAVSRFVRRGHTVSVVRTCVYGQGDRVIADITTNHLLARRVAKLPDAPSASAAWTPSD